MPQFNVPEDITVKDFFDSFVPKQFEESIQGVDLSMMDGKEFTLQFNIDDHKYCLKINNGKELEVIEGGVDKPMLTVCLSEDFWRDSVTGKIAGAVDQFTDANQVADLRRYNALLNTSGTMNVDLTMDDGGVVPLQLVFNGAENPQVKIKVAYGDWVDMQTGAADGQALFMQGKLRFEGDMMFLMSLNALM